MKKIIPIIIAILGLVAGAAAGFFLKPAPPKNDKAHQTEPTAHQSPESTAAGAHGGETKAANTQKEGPVQGEAKPGDVEYVKLNNQFVVPVVSGERVASLVVLSISIEVTAGNKEVVFSREPRLRDALLRALFRHANAGGFEGDFTDGEKMTDLRSSLFEAARKVLGNAVSDVLITNIVRQDA